jgi:hypothetical protein
MHPDPCDNQLFSAYPLPPRTAIEFVGISEGLHRGDFCIVRLEGWARGICEGWQQWPVAVAIRQKQSRQFRHSRGSRRARRLAPGMSGKTGKFCCYALCRMQMAARRRLNAAAELRRLLRRRRPPAGAAPEPVDARPRAALLYGCLHHWRCCAPSAPPRWAVAPVTGLVVPSRR